MPANETFAQQIAHKLAEAILYNAGGNNGWHIQQDPTKTGVIATNTFEQEVANDPHHIAWRIMDPKKEFEAEVVQLEHRPSNDSRLPVLFSFTSNQDNFENSENAYDAFRCFAEIAGIDKGMSNPNATRESMDVSMRLDKEILLWAPSLERIAVALNKYIAYKNLNADKDAQIKPLAIPGRALD